MSFHELVVGEKVLHNIKRHNIIVVVKSLRLFLKYLPALLISGALFFFHQKILLQVNRIPFPPQNGMSWEQVLNIVELGILGIIIFLFLTKLYKLIFNWNHDVLIITNHRVIQIDQHFWWGKDMNFVHLKDIVNITEHHLGFWQVMFKYGDIMIDTSSAIEQDFKMKYIPHPEEVIQMIENAKNQSLVEAQAQQFQHYFQNLPPQSNIPPTTSPPNHP